MDVMDEEEEIPVKYRLRGETDWTLKKEAVMTLAKTQWAIRLKLCKQGGEHNYYSLHVALLTPGHVARAQIKCHRESEEKTDWLQEYTFGGVQNVLVNPCLMKVAKEKVTFVVEIKLLWDKEVPYELPNEISFPNADFALKVDQNKLMVNSEYLKRRAPLIGYMFEDEEKKEYDIDGVDFQDVVDVFGAMQHHWQFSATRMLELIPIARKLGFDLWNKSLNREFSELMYRNEQVKIVPLENETPEQTQLNVPVTWTIDDVSQMTSSTSSPKQTLMLEEKNDDRKCIIFIYTQECFGQKYLSFGFQIAHASTSSEDSEDETPDPIGLYDIEIALVDADGNLVLKDAIRRILDENYVIVGSPVYQKWEDVMEHVTEDDKLTFQFTLVPSRQREEGEDYEFPGLKDGEIVCEDTVLKVNKGFLSHHSEYFRGLFSDRFIEGRQSTVKLPYEKFEVLSSALEFLYNRRQLLNEIEVSRLLDCADRMWLTAVTEGIQYTLWSSSSISTEDRKWLAEQFMLNDLEVKCVMEENEEELKVKRTTRKRARPADFEDEPPQAPPQPPAAPDYELIDLDEDEEMELNEPLEPEQISS